MTCELGFYIHVLCHMLFSSTTKMLLLFIVTLDNCKMSQFQKRMHPASQYFAHRQQTNAIVFNILSAIKQGKFHSSTTINTEVSSFGYAIYFS